MSLIFVFFLQPWSFFFPFQEIIVHWFPDSSIEIRAHVLMPVVSTTEDDADSSLNHCHSPGNISSRELLASVVTAACQEILFIVIHGPVHPEKELPEYPSQARTSRPSILPFPPSHKRRISPKKRRAIIRGRKFFHYHHHHHHH